ncbi:ROK family protein [Intrasporangium sp. YIM S08009]|uniref:ROK family protein n=1 Tax=Intrasporangium zincisolvens TaxID=3080018 RepID=UPI002B05A148|nr:ROK family protein [Intrasporangium sp. YIM S08009]
MSVDGEPGARLGIDIGGTKTAVALVGPDASVLALRTTPSGRGPHGVVEVAARLAHEVALEAGGLSRVAGVGACMPGLVDPATGLARHAVNLDVDAVDLAGELGRRLGRPVAVENDVKAAALGAWRLRADASGASGASGALGPGALAYLNLGTGLASAVVRDGVVVRGIAGAAGEIGHLPVAGDAPCTCGQVGCLETVASGSALARLWPARTRLAPDPFVAAAAGDLAARMAVDVIASGVGLAVQVLALASGAEQVLAGGGLAGLGAPLLEAVRADLERRSRASRLVAALELPDRFALLPATLPVAAVGASFLAVPRARTGVDGAAPPHRAGERVG